MSLPAGTATFLFTDIEGSTKLWEKYPEAMKSALAKYDSVLNQAIESNNGQIIKTTQSANVPLARCQRAYYIELTLYLFLPQRFNIRRNHDQDNP